MYWFKMITVLLGGLGLFVFGMNQMEDALKNLGGRNFKLFLKKHTENKFKAIFSGAFVTTILQSSSLVNLMVLAFVGAGVMTFRNAFSVTIGSNLGTTFSNWILAFIGFNLKVTDLALPVIAIGIILFLLFSGNNRVKLVSKFMFGFGILFLGLEFMKQSFQDIFQAFDFKPFLSYPLIFFTFMGFVITAIIQSSSATVVILLSAMYGGSLTLTVVAAMVVGAELGSSMKLIIGAFGGIADKKRLAISNFLFNLSASILAFIFLDYLLDVIAYVGITNPYLSVVAFQSLFNIGGILIVLPFLNRFCNWMEKRYRDYESFSTQYIRKIQLPLPEMGVDLMEKEAELLLNRVLMMNMRAFVLNDKVFQHNADLKAVFLKDNSFTSYSHRYMDVKKAEGEMIEYFYKLNEGKLEHDDSVRLNRLMSCVRNAMYSAKSIRDVYEDRLVLQNALNQEEYNQYKEIQEELGDFYLQVIQFMEIDDSSKLFDELVMLLSRVHLSYAKRLKDLYREGIEHDIEEVDLSTLLNVNREVFSSCKALVFSVKDLKLNEDDAQRFDNLPMKVLG